MIEVKKKTYLVNGNIKIDLEISFNKRHKIYELTGSRRNVLYSGSNSVLKKIIEKLMNKFGNENNLIMSEKIKHVGYGTYYRKILGVNDNEEIKNDK